MRILIDADACPVVDRTIRIAKRYQIECILLCDTAHEMNREGVQTVILPKGADRVDFALVNRVQKGDLVITQDYGLAAMCLARSCRVLRQDGVEYTSDNIDGMLATRHIAREIRRAGGRTKGPRARTKEQDLAFERALCGICVEIMGR